MKYILYPGEVYSVNDGQRHYVTANQLMKLYGVSPRNCVLFHDYAQFSSDMIPLHPRSDGNYEIPQKE